ncbi:MAG: bifunctional folylpolyglutamate synthase/dihydrofolate synthase [Dehalococcoidales bacterium]|nr:bifunctional folylpolyglutamate synthase/dihydrofolate synthase [Dehalococcoidales bacterium]
MADSPFQQALDFIYSFIDYERQRTPRTRQTWDLKRIQNLLARLANPHLQVKTVHVAGSKGKGSTSSMVASVLTAAGYKTGLYTSPHLHLYNERIRIDGHYITNDEIVALISKIKPAVEVVNLENPEKNEHLTTFEITTALGFLYFAAKKAEFQVIEVGLGGRLDATNVVQPEVSVITSISYEHTELLGNTLTAIAGEKAGIIKPGGIVVVAPQVPEAEKAITAIAGQQHARQIYVGRDITYKSTGFSNATQSLLVRGRLDTYGITIPLLGKFQLDNAATAVGALEVLIEKGYRIPKTAIIEGMANVQWEGRLQILNHEPLVITDGAHNQDSIHKLCEALRQYFKYDQAILVLGMSADKDVTGIVSELAPFFGKVIATRSVHPRSMLTAPIAAEFRKHNIDIKQTEDISVALPMALRMAGKNDLICVTGSLFVAAGAIEQALVLGLKP